jgi:hypothetical protein
VVDVSRRAAAIACLHVASERRRPAVLDGPHGATLDGRQRSSCEEIGAVRAHDVGQLDAMTAVLSCSRRPPGRRAGHELSLRGRWQVEQIEW